MRRLTLLIALFLSLCVSVQAQSTMYLADTSIKLFAYGQQRTIPWCGGFNNPKFAMADLNNDGLPDLVSFENFLSLTTFINVGTAGNPQYRYAPEYELNFPPLYDYIVMADYNCDGIADLFQQGSTGFAVYTGYYNSNNQLCFNFYKNLFYQNDAAGELINAFNNPGDVPAIVDVDNDGDLDFLSYNIIGGNINYYRNMRVELGLPCDSIVIHLENECWGEVYQGFFRTHYLATPETASPCDNSGLILPRLAGRVTHTGNTPCLFDWDGDGDYDYLDGSISFNQMTFLENGRIPYNPTGRDSMFYQDTMWQSTSVGTGTATPVSINMSIWPVAFNLDIDQDGKKDLLVSPNTSQLSENYNCVWFYKNYTTPGVPDWEFKSDSMFIDQTIDLGTASYPMLFDYNNDGLPDLFIGSDGYFQDSTGLLRSRMSYYMNTSTPGSPSFTLQSTDFLGLNSYAFQGIAPAFGDIDNDGKADMVIGHTDGTLSYFKNTAASAAAHPVWVLQQLQLKDNTGAVINVGNNSAPFIYDIDKDGKNDLIIGEFDGYIQYYRNITTTPGTISLQLINTELGGVDVDPDNFIGNYSTPFIGKIDSSGVDYLLVGSNSGNIYEYTGFQTGDTSAIYTLLSGDFDYIDSTYNLYNNTGTADALYGDIRSTVTVGDIAGDGSLFMIVGNTRGGVQLYKYKESTPPAGITAVNEKGKLTIYPNPAKDVLNVNWSGVLQPTVQISILNMEGQMLSTSVSASSIQHKAISLSALPSGVYVCLMQSGTNKYYSKFTVVR